VSINDNTTHQGNIMDNQYRIVNQCLQLLKQSDLPTIKKLRVEIQLIQMKRLLLNDGISKEVRNGSCGDDVFVGLLCEMQKICDGNADGEVLAELMDRMAGMLSVLGSETSL